MEERKLPSEVRAVWDRSPLSRPPPFIECQLGSIFLNNKEILHLNLLEILRRSLLQIQNEKDVIGQISKNRNSRLL